MVARFLCGCFQINPEILGNEPATVYYHVLSFVPHQFRAPEGLISNRPVIQPKCCLTPEATPG